MRCTHQLSARDYVFIDCWKEYFHYSSKALWLLSWVHFYGPTINAIYDKYLERGGELVFSSDRVDDYRELLHIVFDTATTEFYVRDVRLAEKLTRLIALLMKNARIGQKRLSVVEIKQYIDNHYPEKLSLDEMANEFFINKNYLARIFKE